MPKTSYTIKLDSELLEELRRQAADEHRALNNMIETALIRGLEASRPKPQPQTQENPLKDDPPLTDDATAALKRLLSK